MYAYVEHLPTGILESRIAMVTLTFAWLVLVTHFITGPATDVVTASQYRKAAKTEIGELVAQRRTLLVRMSPGSIAQSLCYRSTLFQGNVL